MHENHVLIRLEGSMLYINFLKINCLDWLSKLLYMENSTHWHWGRLRRSLIESTPGICCHLVIPTVVEQWVWTTKNLWLYLNSFFNRLLFFPKCKHVWFETFSGNIFWKYFQKATICSNATSLFSLFSKLISYFQKPTTIFN